MNVRSKQVKQGVQSLTSTSLCAASHAKISVMLMLAYCLHMMSS